MPDGSLVAAASWRRRAAGERDLLYRLLLGRPATSEEAGALRRRWPLGNAAAALIGSAEFRDRVLEPFLGRGTLPHDARPAADLRAAGRLAAAARLVEPAGSDLGPRSRTAAALERLEGIAFVRAAYHAVLAREPNAEELQRGLARLWERSGPAKRQIVAELAASDECRDAAGRMLPASDNGLSVDAALIAGGWRGLLYRVFGGGPAGRALRRLHAAEGERFAAALNPRHPDLILEIATFPAAAPSGEIPVRDRLWIEGWALARAGVAAVEILRADMPPDAVCRGLLRPDVAAVFGDWPDADRSGFAAMLPAAALPTDGRPIRVVLRDAVGNAATAELFLAAIEGGEKARPGAPPAATERDFYRRLLPRLDWHPCFCLALPLAASAIDAARATLAALRDQPYPDWRLIAVAEGDADPDALRDRLVDGADDADRVVIVAGDRATPLARLARRSAGGHPALLIPLEPGAAPGISALYELAAITGISPEAELVIAGAGERQLCCATLGLIDRMGAGPDELWRQGAGGFAWHCGAAATGLRHIPLELAGPGAQSVSDAGRRSASFDATPTRRRPPTRSRHGMVDAAQRRRDLAERFLAVDRDWISRRYKGASLAPLLQAAEAPAGARRRLLRRAGGDFSPFISVRRLREQFPEYDFSSSEDLVAFIERRASSVPLLSPHWLFDDEFYRDRHAGSDRERVRYFEFLLAGAYERRRPHPLFNTEWYSARRIGGEDTPEFFDFLQRGIFEDLSPSPLFDPEFYRAMYPQVSEAIATGIYACSLEHFVMEGEVQGLLPSADWDPDYYLAQNPDVAEGIATGSWRSAFDHWLHCGIAENRAPNPYFDGKYYLEAYPSAEEEIRRYGFLGAFEHFAVLGRRRRWLGREPLQSLAIPIEHAKALYMRRCELSVFRVRNQGPIHFAPEEQPYFSVVISAYNNFVYNIRVLELLEHAAVYMKAKTGRGIEVVVVDNGSSDETVSLETYAKGIVFRSVSPNIGFPRACNLGASLAAGEYLIFLNNDVELEPDVLARLYAVVERDKEAVACFGGAILQFDGSIQDLGSGLWQDGVAQGHFRDAMPARYAFAYPRDVDYVAGCFFCISAADFRSFGGFDERYSPGYYEETDLCLRLWKSGKRVRVYPDIRVYHLEFGAFSSGTTPRAAISRMARNRVLFARQHEDLLESRPPYAPPAGYPARHEGMRPRLLFIEDRVPAFRMGSGFGRAETILRGLLAVADIDIFACHRDNADLIPEDFRYLDIAYGPDPERLESLLSRRHYDAVYVCRPHNLAYYEEVLRRWKQGGGKIVYDTEAIAAVRDTARLERFESYAAIRDSERFRALIEEELRPADIADLFVAVNDFEAAILRQKFDRPVHTIGHHFAARPLEPGASGRAGLLFVGSLYDAQTPNYESLVWFLDHVWPRIRSVRPKEELHIAGFVRAEVPLDALRRDGVACLGPVPDLTSEYARARLFIAPTRFAAGIPFKVQEALSYGLPVVCSKLLAEQLAHTGNFAGVAAAATVYDDGRAFAEACLALLTDDELWARRRQAGLDYIAESCAPQLLSAGAEALLRELGGNQRYSTGDIAARPLVNLIDREPRHKA